MDKSKKKLSIIYIGHLAIDSIIRFRETRNPTLGGSVSYGSLALSCYTNQVKIGIISNLGARNFKQELLHPFKENNINLNGLKWVDTLNTNFVLEYEDHTRNLTLKSKSPNMKFEDFPKSYLNYSPDIIVLGPLCNEISFEYVEKIKKKFPNAYIGLDVQGFIRKIDQQGKISYVKDEYLIQNLARIISLIGDNLILKGSEIEMKLISNEEKLTKVLNYFKIFDNKGIYIMTLGDSGSMILKRNHKILKIPAFESASVIDETGAGDVYLAIFLYEFFNSNRSWKSIKKAGLLASSAASFLIEEEGTSGCQSRERVLERMDMNNYIK